MENNFSGSTVELQTVNWATMYNVLQKTFIKHSYSCLLYATKSPKIDRNYQKCSLRCSKVHDINIFQRSVSLIWLPETFPNENFMNRSLSASVGSSCKHNINIFFSRKTTLQFVSRFTRSSDVLN